MLTVTLPATATHNSAGAGVVILQPDEVNQDGTLAPDVPSNAESPGGGSPNYDGADDHPYVQTYHDNLEGTDAMPREHPADQSGERYSECNGPDDGDYDPANDPNDCYIGFMDMQWEYQILTTTGGPYQENTFKHRDDLYPVNPDPEDDRCPGPGEDAEAYAANIADTGKCTGENHRQYTPPHNLAIDTDLMEPGSEAVAQAAGTPSGSGTLTFPFLTSYYLFLFGEPHPDNKETSGYEAGQGIFGPSPLEGGNPLIDLTGACGDRTDRCELLEPEDIQLYDRYDNNDDPKDVARVCTFEPQYATVNPGDEIPEGPCGPFGDRVGQYVHTDSGGGMGIEGGPDTFTNIPPGWYDNLFFINIPTASLGLNLAGDLQDDDEGFDDGFFMYTAVNPNVPTAESAVWCARPNFIGTPSDIPGTTLSDHGLYDYEADAIDSDIYAHPATGPAKQARDLAHGPARTVLSPIEDLSDDTQGTVNDLADQNLPPQVADALDRTDYQESDEDEGDSLIKETFSAEVSEGLRCDGNGQMQLTLDPETPTAGVTFDMDIQENSGGFGTCDQQATGQLGVCSGSFGDVTLKDPTLVQDGLPARESDTAEGHWSPTALTVEGTVRGVVDTNLNDEFDACQIATGQPDPNNDQCPWRAIWDVYNTACADSDGKECGTLARNKGYNIDATGADTSGPFGVGLYFVAQIAGPVLVTDEQAANADPTVVGDANPTAQNCIIGISVGFQDHLADHIGSISGTDDTWDDEDEDALCGDTDGERLVISDAFEDQDGPSGSFSASVDLVKLTPTPFTVRDNVGDLGSSDQICTTGIWTVNDGATAGDTTNAHNMKGDTHYNDCDTLATGTN